MKLWLQRHAPVLCEPGLCYGSTDFAADAAATCVAAQSLAAELPVGMLVHFSPLRRCASLAEALHGLRPDLAVAMPDPRLAEMHFGSWEGRAWGSIGEAEMQAWTSDFADARPAGDGESVRAFMARVASAFDEWHSAGRETAWITHAGVARAVHLLAEGVRCPERADQWPAEPALALGAWRVLHRQSA